MEKITLQDVSGARLEVRAKARVFVVFVAVAYFAADGEVPVFTSQRDILQVVQNFFLAIRISEQAPILLISKRSQNGPLLLTLRQRKCVKEKQEWNKNQASHGEQ
jgi:hypothetical protein